MDVPNGSEYQGAATFCGIPLNDFSREDQGKIISAVAKQDQAALRDLVNMAEEIIARSMVENDRAVMGARQRGVSYKRLVKLYKQDGDGKMIETGEYVETVVEGIAPDDSGAGYRALIRARLDRLLALGVR